MRAIYTCSESLARSIVMFSARLTYTFNTPYTNSRFVTSKFTRLDEEKGTLRILLTLQETQSQFTKTQLIESLQKAGLGRSGFYSSYNTLKEIGLVNEETGKNREGRRILLPSLSGLGNVIALDLRRLQLMLDST